MGKKYLLGMKGFTLIELLVVIAIIALLLSILMPALNKVKEEGKMMMCLSNHKNLALAWNMYTSENTGKLVGGSAEGRLIRRGKLLSEFPDDVGWVRAPLEETGAGPRYNFGDDTTPTKLEYEINGIEHGLLWSYLEDIKVYHCPADKRATMGTDIAQPSSFRSYGMPTTMNGEGFYVSKGDMATKDTHIKLPSNKFVFMDDFDERSFSIGCWVFGYQNRRFRDPVAIWHSKKAVFSYADGHAKFYKWKDERSYRYAKTTVYNLLATDPDYITNVDASENPVNEDAVFIAAGYTPR